MQNELQNIVGPQIRGYRYAREWSQAMLAVKLQLVGFDMSRESLAKVESQIHKVEDFQLPYYARALSVQVIDLFPPLPSDKPINVVITALRAKRNRITSLQPTVFRNGTVVPVEPPRASISRPARLGEPPPSIQKKKQMTLPLVQIRTKSK